MINEMIILTVDIANDSLIGRYRPGIHNTIFFILIRYANWKKDHAEVALHNAKFGNEFTQAVNELSDLTDEEYKEFYLSGYLMAEEEESNSTLYVPSNEPIPNNVDWRSQGLVTEIKNQGRCGSCYSFSATGALEGNCKFFIKNSAPQSYPR